LDEIFLILGVFIFTCMSEGFLVSVPENKLQIPAHIIKSMQAVIEYLWEEEKHNYESSELSNKSDHIFNSVKIIKKWLDQYNRLEE